MTFSSYSSALNRAGLFISFCNFRWGLPFLIIILEIGTDFLPLFAASNMNKGQSHEGYLIPHTTQIAAYHLQYTTFLCCGVSIPQMPCTLCRHVTVMHVMFPCRAVLSDACTSCVRHFQRSKRRLIRFS